MANNRAKFVSRLALALLILLSGLAMLPFSGLTAESLTEKLTWEQFAGGYQPILTVDESVGAPGSAFLFKGADYPPQALATIYVNGVARGTLLIGLDGTADFLLQSHPTDPLGIYNVTLATDPNISATVPIELVEDAEILPPPIGFSGPVFDLNILMYLPLIYRQGI
jgi:hypothetical protein